MKVSEEFFEAFYNELSEGQKQHMSNKIYKETGRYPQKLDVAKPKPPRSQYVVGDKFTQKASGRTYILSSVSCNGDAYLYAVNTHTGRAYTSGVLVPKLIPFTDEYVSKAFANRLDYFVKEL